MCTAILFGATGMVGNTLLHHLLSDDRYTKIISIGRRKLPLTHTKLTQHIGDLLDPNTYKDKMTGDHVFICLGTTINKAGTQEKFKKVDVEMPIAIAKTAHQLGIKKIALISSVGANEKSRIFYSRCKGEVENKIQTLNFETFYVFRPSFLVGSRSEFRFAEKIGIGVAKILKPITPSNYKPIRDEALAKAMIESLNTAPIGHHIIHYKEIKQLILDK